MRNKEDFGISPQPKDTKDKRGIGGNSGNSISRKTDSSVNGKKGFDLGNDDKGTLSGPKSGKGNNAAGKGKKGWDL